MTREEQIKEYLKERNIPIDSLEANSIMEGINWADKHPDYDYDGLSEEALAHEVAFIDDWLDGHKTLPTFAEALEWEKNRVVDKACEWLRINLYNTQDNCGYKVVASFDSVYIKEFIEHFKRAMEE